MENYELHNKTEADRKAALEEALKRVRPVVLGHNEPVGKRLEHFANRPVNEDSLSHDALKKEKKPLSLEELAKKGAELEKKAEKAGIDLKSPVSSKEIEEKGKEKEKEKDKEKEMFSKVNLPSGLEIHQEGPSWVLVSKDGKERTDVTDVMNTIDKYNKSVDVANEENRMQNAAQSSVDKAAGEHDKNMEAKGVDAIHDDKVTSVEQALPLVKDVDGNSVFKPEDVKAVAETAVSFAEEKAMLEKLKDPKALEQMRKREKDNEDKAEARLKAMQMYNSRQQARGGREMGQ